MPRPRYIVCTCSAVYERRVLVAPRYERGSFVCDCGRELGAWNGLSSLHYKRVREVAPTILPARRVACA